MDILGGNDDFSLFHGQAMVACLVYVKRVRDSMVASDWPKMALFVMFLQESLMLVQVWIRSLIDVNILIIVYAPK